MYKTLGRRKIMQGKTSRTVGWVLFVIGALYMVGLGWLYSWWVVPATREAGPAYIQDLVGFVWALAVPLGSVLVLLGAALLAQVERRLFGALVIGGFIFAAWRVFGTTSRMLPPLFGIGGGLITLFFLGLLWSWVRSRPTLSGPEKTGSDLRAIGYLFFVVAAWDLCGLLGIPTFLLRPEQAQEFAIPASFAISMASTILVLLVLGWAFMFFGQWIAVRARSEAGQPVATADVQPAAQVSE
jgi:hypothetical protein